MESDSERKKVCSSSTVVVVCNEDKGNPVTFKWKWGEDELPIADQFSIRMYEYLGVEIPKECSWDAHTKSDVKG